MPGDQKGQQRQDTTEDWPAGDTCSVFPQSEWRPAAAGAGGRAARAPGSGWGRTGLGAAHLPQRLQLLLELGHLPAGVGAGLSEMLDFLFLDQHLSVC